MGLAIIIPGVSYADANLGKVTITGDRPIEAITIIGEDSIIGTAQYNVRMYPYNTTDRGIIWSIDSGGNYATINSEGVLSALEGADENEVVIRATSSADATITATKTISVSFTGHVVIPLSYIAADGGKYIDTGIDTAQNQTIKADFQIANIQINNTTDRQYIYSDTANLSVSYSKKWNAFTINHYGTYTKTVSTFYNRGLSTASSSGITLYDKTYEQNVTLTSSTVPSGSYGNRIYLFTSLNNSQTMKKTVIYGFEIVANDSSIIDLEPVLYDGEPCFYDSVSDTYIHFLGDTGNIWYATAANPNTEIQYSE